MFSLCRRLKSSKSQFTTVKLQSNFITRITTPIHLHITLNEALCIYYDLSGTILSMLKISSFSFISIFLQSITTITTSQRSSRRLIRRKNWKGKDFWENYITGKEELQSAIFSFHQSKNLNYKDENLWNSK